MHKACFGIPEFDISVGVRVYDKRRSYLAARRRFMSTGIRALPGSTACCCSRKFEGICYINILLTYVHPRLVVHEAVHAAMDSWALMRRQANFRGIDKDEYCAYFASGLAASIHHWDDTGRPDIIPPSEEYEAILNEWAWAFLQAEYTCDLTEST